MTRELPVTSTTLTSDRYYRSGDRVVELVPDERLVAVSFRGGDRSLFDSTPEEGSGRVHRATPLSFLPGLGVHIVELEDGIDEIVETLERDPRVDLVSPIYRTPADDGTTNDDAVVFTTRRVVAQFPIGTSRTRVEDIARERRAAVLGEASLPDSYVLEAPSTVGPHGCVALANRLVDEGLALRASPDIVHELQQRSRSLAVPEHRSLRSDQWHLDVADVPDAWTVTKGAGATIAVLDDGLDTRHPEFDGRIDDQYDFELGVADATPKLGGDSHGTACTGVAAAGGLEATGIAPEARIVAVRTPFGLGTVEELEMWAWVGQRADVVSCSWGPAQPYYLPDVTAEALRTLAQDTREGKGMPIFFAAGNEAEDMTTDGYAASPYVVAVGASTDEDFVAPYSDYGPELDICAPSSGGVRDVTTTDRSGSDGYSPGDYTAMFGGTSAATPLVAGVAALMVSANPDLTADKVKSVLYDTAEKIGSASDYDTAGHSIDFGFGRVQAAAAVVSARDLASETGGSGSSSPLTHPSVAPPVSVRRGEDPPTFVVSLAGNRYYSIELATEARLFDQSMHGADRDESNFTSTFRETGNVANSPSWQPSADSWARLSQADRVFYRMLSSENSNGTGNFHMTTADDEAAFAPSIAVVDRSDSTATSNADVVFPSGSRFTPVTDPEDDLDYYDPVTAGSVHLLEIRSRLDEQLSDDFRVKEFVARIDPPPRYARISPEFVDALQRVRDAAAARIMIRSAYRYPAKNSAVGGAPRSQHLVGRAADLVVSEHTPLEMAEVALRTLGPTIGVGLGARTIHLDTSGELATWTYEGAELSESDFDRWARETAGESDGRIERERRESSDRGAPQAEGPLEWRLGDEVPAFLLRPGDARYVALDLVTERKLFTVGAGDRTADNSYGTWEQGLVDTRGRREVLVRPEPERWEQLARNEQVYYRAVTSRRAGSTWDGLRSSVDDLAWSDYPSVDTQVGSTSRRATGSRFLGGRKDPRPAPRVTNRPRR